MTAPSVKALRRAAAYRRQLAEAFPWTASPLVVGAPMRVFAGPALAVAITRAGGLGFLGPQEKAESMDSDLAEVRNKLLEAPVPQATAERQLPVGIGFQIWNGNLVAATGLVQKYRPCAVWLFAPRHGQPELDEWTVKLREASPVSQIWVQVGTLREALAAASSKTAAPDALVIQGAEAGGHGRAVDGVGVISLLPEVANAMEAGSQPVKSMPLVSAGGIADGRGVVASLGLGASAAAMGTRFLAATEARISRAYQDEVVRAVDGAAHTKRTHLYNHLRGTFGWPEQFSPRALLNDSWSDHQAGVAFDELKKRHDEALKKGGAAAWGPHGRVATYAGASVGLVQDVQGAAEIVQGLRQESKEIAALL